MGMMNRKVLAKLKPGDRVKPRLICGPGRTKQEFVKECDINHIMKRFKITGQLPGTVQALQPVFMDVSQIGSFADVQERIHRGEAAFMELSPEVRFRFSNQPSRLIEFLQDSRNRAEAVALGLISEKGLDSKPDSPKVQPPSVEATASKPQEATPK